MDLRERIGKLRALLSARRKLQAEIEAAEPSIELKTAAGWKIRLSADPKDEMHVLFQHEHAVFGCVHLPLDVFLEAAQIVTRAEILPEAQA